MVNFYSFAKFSAITAATTLVIVATGPMASADPRTLDPYACKRDGNTVTCTWDQPGKYDQVIPDGATSVSFEVYGAQGGSTNQARGGLGGAMHAETQKVLGGPLKLQLNVGGEGKSVKGEHSGGQNGGGEPSAFFGVTGGGGGGRSDILLHNQSVDGMIIAGAGGGAGVYGAGGAGGEVNGETAPGAGGGSGATGPTDWGQTPATPGKGNSVPGVCLGGYDGSLKNGGNGYSCWAGAGGGGAGWYGGGGGTAGRGGGGGIGWIDDSLRAFFSTKPTGGGVQSGNGKIVLTYTAP